MFNLRKLKQIYQPFLKVAARFVIIHSLNSCNLQ